MSFVFSQALINEFICIFYNIKYVVKIITCYKLAVVVLLLMLILLQYTHPLLLCLLNPSNTHHNCGLLATHYRDSTGGYDSPSATATRTYIAKLTCLFLRDFRKAFHGSRTHCLRSTCVMLYPLHNRMCFSHQLAVATDNPAIIKVGRRIAL